MRNFSELPILNTSSQNWSSFVSLPREGRQLPSRSTEAQQSSLDPAALLLSTRKGHTTFSQNKKRTNETKALPEVWILSGHLQEGAKRSYDHKYSPLFRPASYMYNPGRSIYNMELEMTLFIFKQKKFPSHFESLEKASIFFAKGWDPV